MHKIRYVRICNTPMPPTLAAAQKDLWSCLGVPCWGAQKLEGKTLGTRAGEALNPIVPQRRMISSCHHWLKCGLLFALS